MAIPKKVSDRMIAGMKTLRPIIDQQLKRDVSESDTVTLIKDVLSLVLGYDKYAEMTSEHQIRGTYCDIVLQIDSKIVAIVEVKAIGINLDEKHVKQAVDYAANQGVDWVILTNGNVWRMYAVIFAKPIDHHLICEISLLDGDYKKPTDFECLYLFARESMIKGYLKDHYDRQLAVNRHLIAALLIHNDSVVSAVRRELKRISGVNADIAEIMDILKNDVIKREVLDGEAAKTAGARVNKLEDKPLRRVSKAKATTTVPETPSEASSETNPAGD